ncbi:MAG: outer membrane beta-barrel protein [Hyphomicrobiaceae bacterium]|nr:outer membrane beta-barrel protein [Hyphomicrobiaceae bacterium]
MRGSIGVSLWLAAGAAGLAVPAAAQVPVETVIQAPAPNRAKLQPRRPQPERVEVDDPEATGREPPPQRLDGEEPEADADTADAALAERRLVPLAGDLRDVARELRGPVDGTIDDGTHVPVVVDGIGDLRRDARRPEDIAAFTTPPAGYDALAFQIEQIDPLNDRRTDRLFRFEPYAPVGVRLGSFVLYPEAELGGLYNSNVYRSSLGSGAGAAEGLGSLRLVSDWRRHALELRAAGRATFYDRYASEDDRTWSLEARGRLDITRRANIEAAVTHTSDKDARSVIDAPTNAAVRGEIETDRVAATYNQQLGRATLQLRGALTDVAYSDVTAVNGATISNASRNFTQTDEAVRLSWALNRAAAVFVDAAFRQRAYAVAAGDGIARSSASERYRLGLAFSPLGPRLRGEISLGWGHQGQWDRRLPDMQGVLLDASLAWRASGLTTVLLTARSDFYDTTLAGSPGALAREVGAEVRHALKRHLIATLGLRYALSPYQSVSLEERLLTGEAGLDYFLNANLSLYGRYQHLEFRSTDETRNYTADIVRLGLRVRQ